MQYVFIGRASLTIDMVRNRERNRFPMNAGESWGRTWGRNLKRKPEGTGLFFFSGVFFFICILNFSNEQTYVLIYIKYWDKYGEKFRTVTHEHTVWVTPIVSDHMSVQRCELVWKCCRGYGNSIADCKQMISGVINLLKNGLLQLGLNIVTNITENTCPINSSDHNIYWNARREAWLRTYW